MEIIYKQSTTDTAITSLGVHHCYLKHLRAETDSQMTSTKTHRHACYELHFINKGHQRYVIGEREYNLECGDILLIPPLVKHCACDSQFYESKFSITYNLSDDSPMNVINDVVFVQANQRIFDSFDEALSEIKISSVFSKQIISNCVYESLVQLLRLCGYKERREVVENILEDDRLIFAKRYIKDNIEFNVTVAEVAAHCSLGTKQLTRLFKQYEGTTPLGYIQKQKIRRIETLLSNGVKLKEVSEIMNFSSEYHFNSFYKKYTGITPGMYRKASIK